MEQQAKEPKDVTFVIVRDGKALMQHRTDDARRYPGAWCFPGGGIDDGENALEAVMREVKEEYHLHVVPSDCRHLLTYEHDGTDVDSVFLCGVGSDQEPKLGEGKAFAWKSLPEIEAVKLGFEQERILPTLAQFLPH